MKYLNKGFVGFVFFMSLSAVGLANIAFWSFKGNTLFAFLSVFVGWTNYLFAHYMSEGKFIDGNEEDQDHKMRPGKKEEAFGIVLGTIILVSGMGIGVHALRESNLIFTIGAALLFHIGYVVAHYSATRELV